MAVQRRAKETAAKAAKLFPPGYLSKLQGEELEQWRGQCSSFVSMYVEAAMDRQMCDQFCQLSEGLSASAWAEGVFLRTSTKDANSPGGRRRGNLEAHRRRLDLIKGPLKIMDKLLFGACWGIRKTHIRERDLEPGRRAGKLWPGSAVRRSIAPGLLAKIPPVLQQPPA